MATIKDVARVAGFSVSTVSIVLRGQAGQRKIPPQTVEKIMSAARDVNYQPNLSARKLRDSGAGQYTIGLFWAADFRTIVLARVLKGLQQGLVNTPYEINLVVSPYTSGRIRDNKALQGITNYNAAIIATTDAEDSRYLEENPPQIPIVFYNRYSTQFSSVTADNDAAGHIAAGRFAAKGITEIGVVLQKRPFIAMSRRSDSFMQACIKHGITGFSENTVWSDGTVTGGFNAGMQILERGNIPQGIYCDSDSTAMGLLNAFAKHGKEMPENMELVAMGTAPPF